MSYDVYLTIDTGGPEPAWLTDWNYTSNCAGMWRAAGCDIAEFHGKPAAELGAALRTAIDNLTGDPGKYDEMNPPNGWGSRASLVVALARLADDCGNHPLATVSVSR